MGKVTRRGFVKYTATATAGAVAYTYFGWAESAVKLLEPVSVDNPLEFYPERDWEKVYRDMYSYDSDFNFCCVPNDTHNCRLKAYVKNGIIIRIEQTYAEDKATDLQGNTATPNWHPRGCLKGYTLVRRFYNPHRLKYPMVRKGWLEWANAGFPRNANGEVEEKYKKRGEDDLIRVTWDEAVEYAAKGLMNISSEYVGE
ncbi:MAG TPA: molybdopterin-dependent oxidoreductase, partial [Nitrososphaerales archaeon]|nr:molybdopterin-dependent oxidoreductase [Nitrososphaerales archaeon]